MRLGMKCQSTCGPNERPTSNVQGPTSDISESKQNSAGPDSSNVGPWTLDVGPWTLDFGLSFGRPVLAQYLEGSLEGERIDRSALAGDGVGTKERIVDSFFRGLDYCEE